MKKHKIKVGLTILFLVILGTIFICVSFFDGENELKCEKSKTYFLVLFDKEKEIKSFVEGKSVKEIESESKENIKFEVDGKYVYAPKDEDYQVIENSKEYCK